MPRPSIVFYALIALFWATMWTLLIHTELRPRGASLRAVPIAKVADVFFRHEQNSDLFIHGEGTHLGRLRLTPHETADNRRVLDFSGNFQYRLGEERQRVIWDGSLEMDRSWAVQTLRVGFSVFDRGVSRAENARTEIEIHPVERLATCTEKFGGAVLDRRSIPLDEAGIRMLLEEHGVDPSLLRNFSSSPTAQPEITAQQSTLFVREQRLDTFLVTVAVNNQTLLEVQVGSLGQILSAKSILGWTLENE